MQNQGHVISVLSAAIKDDACLSLIIERPLRMCGGALILSFKMNYTMRQLLYFTV